MRENGSILVKVNHPLWNHLLHYSLIFVSKNYGGSFANFIRELQQEKSPLTALDVVLKVIEVFPSFRDITTYEGREGRSHDRSLLFFSF